MKNLLLIFIGGGLGSCCRYLLSLWLNTPASNFPLGTFAANVLSCMVLGFASILVIEKLELSTHIRFLIMTGFCGGFSTFSTFDSEIFAIIERDNYLSSLIYAVISILAGLGALFIGMTIGNKVIS
ncbi:fluoride efflux transporter CrcB [Chondrinema litorale]|uniref:fluoride efflux transporter CrcB n=1 Tax=Chondrinema litorale TaxID=2994555 RepID=UPI00254468DF|nr:fluoride efflux transporter CrcB [Chondrinema litorale]UZR93755.1 fluoride efflux transporter CrcB [Chondrinema litorale]